MILTPLTGNRFAVSLDPPFAYLPPLQAALIPPVIDAGFQDVTGLGAELEVMSYAEGGINDHPHQLPVRHKWTNITLKRGVVHDMALWLWYRGGLTDSLGARRDGTIISLTPDGLPSMAWTFRRGLAVKWLGPTLNAAESTVAIEGIEIAHEGIEQVPLVPPGVF